DAHIPQFPADAKGLATRAAAGAVENAISPYLPGLIGGSADLDPSTFTELKDEGNLESPAMAVGDLQGSAGGGWSYAGRNLHFGVREHAMGEDGPTHQPVEQLASLRALPNLMLIRPGDANETAVAWRVAIETRDRPVALVLSRQSVPTLDRKRFASADGLRRGAYILADTPQGTPQLILIATGSEVGLIVAAQQKLQDQHIAVRLVSMPSWDLFEAQSSDYRDAVLPPTVRARLAVEAGVTQGWHRYVGDRGGVMGIDHFGASAPGPVVMREFGFTVEQVCARARAILEQAYA
ncbi:MAG: transketolase-like TK C-terminal-containing protein, partial [Nitrospira sp.]